jgi:hypothetical protein
MKHIFEIGPHVNGGENITIVSQIEDGNIVEQTIEIMAYGNSAQLNLSRNILTPDILRELANQLEKEMNK